MVGQRGRSVTLSDWNHLNDGDSKTAGSGFRCGRPSLRRQQNTEQSRWLTGYFNESRIDSNRIVGGGCFACSHIHHTRVERNDCRRGCVGGSHTLMDGLIGHRVSVFAPPGWPWARFDPYFNLPSCIIFCPCEDTRHYQACADTKPSETSATADVTPTPFTLRLLAVALRDMVLLFVAPLMGLLVIKWPCSA